MSTTLKISRHAYKRAKERFSLKKNALIALAIKAKTQGIRHPYHWHSLIYGEIAFYFDGDILVTLYKLPNHLIKYTKKAK